MLFVLGIYLLSGRAALSAGASQCVHRGALHHVGAEYVWPGNGFTQDRRTADRTFDRLCGDREYFLSELKSWRLALVFAFGLLHGMGFAGALKELGLPRSEFVTALVTFNVGVEAGQLAVIGAAFLLVGWGFSRHLWYRSRIVIPASAAIACMAVYWTIQRLAV